MNVTSTPTSRASVLDIVGYLNEISMDTLAMNNESQNLSDESLSSAQCLIKYSAALACYAYSCPTRDISELGIVPYVREHTVNNQ